MKKQLLLFILMFLPMIASAEEINGINYILDYNTKTATVTSPISGVGNYSGEIVIPSNVEYDNVIYDVISIDNHAFSKCSSLTSVTIPNGVTSVGSKAFFRCASLNSIEIPNSVYYIGESAFNGCTSLSSVTIPNSVIYLGSHAFDGCDGLTSVSLSNSLEEICEHTFDGCSGLISVSIPNGVSKIGNGAFNFCTGLISLTIPNSVMTIGEKAFQYCNSMTSVTIGNGVTSIGQWAFSNCDALTSVHISDIAAWCSIPFGNGNNPLYYAHHLFMNDEEIKDLVIPNNVKSISTLSFHSCKGITSVTIPNSVTKIGNQAFENCSGLTSVTIANSVNEIGSSAFAYCNSLTTITIPNSVTSMGESTFDGCSGLTYISISNSISSIGEFTFQNCNSLTSITIPNSVKTIYRGAFLGCKSLDTVIIGKNVSSIGRASFFNCSNLRNVCCYAKEVPQTSVEVFDGTDIGNGVLQVRAASIDAYKGLSPWNQFGNIESIPNEPNTYILCYILDGVIYQSYEMEEGDIINIEPDPTKEGYTFSGWSEIPATMPAHDVTITGTFTVNQYKLTYMVDGVEYKSYEIDYGTTITPETEPTKEGYTFSGWSEIPETMPANDVTVTGMFTVNKYKVTYMVDGAEYKTYEIDYGTTIMPETEPIKEGYTFSGWSEIPGTMPAHDVTVTGTFTINQYKLTYMIDDKVYKEVVYYYGATIIPEQRPDDEEYVSFEWVGVPETMPAHDVTVYASYETGIRDVLMQQNVIRIYNSNGIVTDRPQKGINIIQMSDGSTRKVIVK